MDLNAVHEEEKDITSCISKIMKINFILHAFIVRIYYFYDTSVCKI